MLYVLTALECQVVVSCLWLCMNCFPSAHAHSAKLVVTTLPRGSPGGGSVVVETLGGGKGVSSIKFTFVEHQTVRVGSVGEGHSPFVKRKTRGVCVCVCACVCACMRAW